MPFERLYGKSDGSSNGEKATRLSSVEHANNTLGHGWLLRVAKWLAVLGFCVVGVAWAGWVPTIGAFVVVLWVKKSVGPSQLEGRFRVKIRFYPKRRNNIESD